MRLDKYLKVSRIIKRRTVAKDFAESERVLINGRVAKPSSEVKKGDVLTLLSGGKKIVFEILEVKENVRAAEAKNLYRIIE
ncbi:MAG: RNA-binding S4 domain-containing protein [Syntrophomonas sp.]